MKTLINSTFILSACITLAGCSSPPRVATPYGFAETSVFEPVFKSQAPGNPQKVLFRKLATPFESESEPSRANFGFDILVIADAGVYSTSWDPETTTLSTSLFIKKQDIKGVKVVEMKYSWLPNCYALNIETTSGANIKFCLSQQLSRNAESIATDLFSNK